VYAAVDEVAAIQDPLARIQMATDLIHAVRAAGEELRDIRHVAAVTLNHSGWGYQRIADALGVTKGRAQQLVQDMRATRRPGVIEVEALKTVSAMRSAGASDAQIADEVVPRIRSRRSGKYMPWAQIAGILEVDENWLRNYLGADTSD
jgi:hypothetical protein